MEKLDTTDQAQQSKRRTQEMVISACLGIPVSPCCYEKQKSQQIYGTG